MSTTNLEQILERFDKGEERYNSDPAFKAVVDSLKMGLGVYGVLDHEIHEVQRLRDKLQEFREANEKLKSELRESKFNLEMLFEELEAWKPWTSAGRGIKKNREI